MKDELIARFEETTKDLLKTLSSVSQEEFNKIPFEDSWTAGQVAEHLFKSESNIPKVLKGNSKETERDPFEKTGIIQKVFLDFNTKLKSPESILPSEEKKETKFFIRGFEGTRKELKNLMQTKDLTRTFTDFPFPQLGEFTGWEWICFAVSHSKRHIRQMKIIVEKLKSSPQPVDDAA
jgi:uncharacterized damage-inducible protein DinB